MKKIKIAQIGIGHDHAEGIFPTLKKYPDIFDIAGYATVNDEDEAYSVKIPKFDDCKKMTVEEILNDPAIQAVTIETCEKNLTKYAIAAAKAGKHIHMDKPGGMELEDFEEFIKIVREKKLIFHTGYMYRYNPEISRVINEAKNGELGTIYSVEAHMSGIFPQTIEKKAWLKQFKGGMMFFLGCHLIDIVLTIMGKPENIIPFNKCTGIDDVDSEDMGFAVLEYKNGTSFVKTSAAEKGGGRRRQVVVCGSENTAEIKPTERYDSGRMLSDTTYNVSTEEKSRTSEFFDRYDEMMKSFAAMVRGDKPVPDNYDYELMLYKCVLKASGYDIPMSRI